MMQILKSIVDTIYQTQKIRQDFDLEHPEETVFASDASKGILKSEDEELKRGLDWVLSQRAVILLTDKRIKCGKWDIQLKNIAKSQLLKINTLGPAYILKIETNNGDHYRFGMQRNPEWLQQKVMPLREESGGIKHSIISIIVRAILAFYLIHFIYNYFVK